MLSHLWVTQVNSERSLDNRHSHFKCHIIFGFLPAAAIALIVESVAR
ncbi:hypothetical protein [Coleofasciculus sp. FACHB-1120]|nr:hypothetical protein [Coleofasciculus sp. FACHB-1120]MBD2742565.1 hypothetical protein [Coleofasciculus sp. FACHB-1120]